MERRLGDLGQATEAGQISPPSPAEGGPPQIEKYVSLIQQSFIVIIVWKPINNTKVSRIVGTSGKRLVVAITVV